MSWTLRCRLVTKPELLDENMFVLSVNRCYISSERGTPVTCPARKLGMAAAGTVGTLSHGCHDSCFTQIYLSIASGYLAQRSASPNSYLRGDLFITVMFHVLSTVAGTEPESHVTIAVRWI